MSSRSVRTPASRSRPKRRRALGAIVSATLLLAGCSGGGSDNSFTVALIEPDIAAVPLLAAVDAVRAQGFDVKVQEAAEPELAIEGLVRGDYQFSAEATSPALIAMSKGAPIRIVADAIGNQWAVYGAQNRDSCDQLDGRPFGIFSEGSVATAMVRQWVSRDCRDGSEPEYLTIGGSDARAQALLSGQIDATALEVTDAITLERAGGGKGLHRLADFKEVFPGLHPQTVYANEDYLGEHRKPSQAFIDAIVAEHRKINADPGYLMSLLKKYLPDAYDDETAKAASRRYVEAGLFDAAGLTPRSLQRTVDFFADAGIVKRMPVEDVADLSFVDRAAAEQEPAAAQEPPAQERGEGS
ncbi:ABC-type nitrate/sulfonate/bicarbonate transport system substrate-binding protein [Streptomyces phaeochromogenes]|nr:ABC-type nitrate/sulfonate/bicarbonate transport system substrate-binding protein [Streptomyces phaeochromogenes]